MVYNQKEQFDSGCHFQRKPQNPCALGLFYLVLCSFWALGTIWAQTKKEGKAIYQSFSQTVPKVLFPLYCFGLLYILPEQCPHQRIACAFLALLQNVYTLRQHTKNRQGTTTSALAALCSFLLYHTKNRQGTTTTGKQI